MNKLDMAGRHAVVTGGATGLGYAIAQRMLASGAGVTLWDLDRAALARAAGELGPKAFTVAVDVGDHASVVDAVRTTLAQTPAVDALVNSAGVTGPNTKVWDYPVDAWQKVMQVNLNGLFYCCRELVPHMRARNYGRIVNIASVAGLGASPPQMEGTIAYNTTKGGLVNFTRQLAAEWGKFNITVNAICPGFFPSKMTKATLDVHAEFFKSQTPLGKLGNDEDLKGAAILFASDAGGHITGQCLVIDGGAIVV